MKNSKNKADNSYKNVCGSEHNQKEKNADGTKGCASNSAKNCTNSQNYSNAQKEY